MEVPLELRLTMPSCPLGSCAMLSAHGEPNESRNNSGTPKVLAEFPALEPRERAPELGGQQELSSRAHTGMGFFLWSLAPHSPKTFLSAEVAASEPGLWVGGW